MYYILVVLYKLSSHSLFFKDAPIPTKQIKITTVVLAVLFSLGHISNYHAVMRAGIPVNQPMFLLAGDTLQCFLCWAIFKNSFCQIIQHDLSNNRTFYNRLTKILLLPLQD